MVNRDVLAAKLTQLALRMKRVQLHNKRTSEELASDSDCVDLVSFNLMMCVQVCVDIASHIIADAAWPAARTLSESFARLREHGVLTQETSAALSRAVGLRNVVAHGYAGLDLDLLHRASTDGLADLDTFAREVAAWLSQN